MESRQTTIFFFLGLLLSAATALNLSKSTYIVHLQRPDTTLTSISEEDTQKWYKSYLPVTTSAEGTAHPRMIHMYNNVITGFAARLTKHELKTMSGKAGFVAAFPDRLCQLLTTRTPAFLGLHFQSGLWKKHNLGRGVIIGLLDSGISPNHPSFSDAGMSPPPAKWKGWCDFNASCNNKLIGARTFLSGAAADSVAVTPTDEGGHGTHTSSTAAGAFVRFAEVFGNSTSTASGMAPGAHIAMYKVCGGDNCFESDILAGMDAAVSDGVDILSISLGDNSAPFYIDNIAIGAFRAIQNGIFVSTAACNNGPNASTLCNEAPWLLTVAASTIDRAIRSTVMLGNGIQLDGETLFQPHNFTPTMYPLVFAGTGVNSTAAFCGTGSLDSHAVAGKIVLCQSGLHISAIEKGRTVKDAGGVGMILMNSAAQGFTITEEFHVLPASHLSFSDGCKILTYIRNQTYPTARIVFKGMVLGTSSAPAIAFFSSRGPSLASPGILKPDITGPGVNILAAWPIALKSTHSVGPTFNIISGTSMATPHLSGIAALIKSEHPNWSPAAIKSALMTTATVTDNTGRRIKDEQHSEADLFELGAGHVAPEKAGDPGLVYDIKPDDYIPYLCGLGYTNDQVGTIVGRNIDCKEVHKISELELNYPSFAVLFERSGSISATRTVRNVGVANSVYVVQVATPTGVRVDVQPKRLRFWKVNQELKFKVTFSVEGHGGSGVAQGSLTWISSKHTVRSPISVTFYN